MINNIILSKQRLNQKLLSFHHKSYLICSPHKQLLWEQHWYSTKLLLSIIIVVHKVKDYCRVFIKNYNLQYTNNYYYYYFKGFFKISQNSYLVWEVVRFKRF